MLHTVVCAHATPLVADAVPAGSVEEAKSLKHIEDAAVTLRVSAGRRDNTGIHSRPTRQHQDTPYQVLFPMMETRIEIRAAKYWKK